MFYLIYMTVQSFYDLTNTCFEGEKRRSKLAKNGRSKEKRRDCPIVVMRMVDNTEGFAGYSAINQGNIADNITPGDGIQKLRAETSTISKKVSVETKWVKMLFIGTKKRCGITPHRLAKREE
jgi:hypothetical protein